MNIVRAVFFLALVTILLSSPAFGQDSPKKAEIKKALLETESTGMNDITFYYGRTQTIVYYEVFNEIFQAELKLGNKEISITSRPYLILHTNAFNFENLAGWFAEYANKLEAGEQRLSDLTPHHKQIVESPVWDALNMTMQAFNPEDTTYTKEYPYLRMHKRAADSMAQSAARIRKLIKENK